MHPRRAVAIVAVVTLGFTASGCGSDEPNDNGPSTESANRVEAISEAVSTWADTDDPATAAAAAETAANLVVGPNGPGYGDRNGDGEVQGETDVGLLPARDGSPTGLVLDEIGTADCVEADVLGGPWTDPGERWAELSTAIEAWSSSNNTFPGLASHPMRVVGWAVLSIEAADLDLAHEYSGHARIHVEVTSEAIAACGR